MPSRILQQAELLLKSMGSTLCRTGLSASRSDHMRCCDKPVSGHISIPIQALTTGLGYVNGFISYYKVTGSSLSSSPHHLSGSLRDSNGKVINTFTFSVLLPPVQISITHSDKKKMKLQSVRLQVFSSLIGTVFKTL